MNDEIIHTQQQGNCWSK